MMDKDVIVHIYVLNWNQPELTVDCVQSLLNQSVSTDYRIFIIDNGSIDNSVEIFNQKFSNIDVLRNESNLGFQGGMNRGLSHGFNHGAGYILIINNDTIADPMMIEELFKNIPNDAALVSPIIYYHNSPKKVWSIGGKINPIFLEVTRFLDFSPSKPQKSVPRDFIPSCAWLLRRETIGKIGYLDENYHPIYYDDLDYCMRLKRQGCKVYLIPQAKLWHKVAISSGGEKSPTERYLMARNSGYYFRKNMKMWQAPFIIIFRLFSFLLWTFRLFFAGKFNSLRSFWRGSVEGWFYKLPE
jgi:GT2 family glycosyltransferase